MSIDKRNDKVKSMKRRLFIAVNLPKDIKNKLIKCQERWADLLARHSLGEGGPVRWTPGVNLHITLVFIGYVGDDEMYEIINIVKETVKQHNSFSIDFKKIILGPPDKPARMFWVEGEKSEELAKLKNDLEDSLLKSNGSGFRKKEMRDYRPHITLGRIKQEQWRGLDPKPKVDEKFEHSFSVETIEVMQSNLKRTGAEYTVLESVELG